MASSIKLSVYFTQQSLEMFGKLGLKLDWGKFMQDYEFKAADPPMIVGDVTCWIEQYLELVYNKLSRDTKKIQASVMAIWHSSSKAKLAVHDEVSQHLKPGDIVIVEVMVLGPVSASFDMSQAKQQAEQAIADLKKVLRFALNDRVLCDCGPRWLSGHIVGTAVADDDGLLAYLVKTDPVPGLPSTTISVPEDTNELCIQETCFDPCCQLHLVKAAASSVPGSQRPKLRFVVGDNVMCRISNDPHDGLEHWVAGTISHTWPDIPGEHSWTMEGISGKYPDVVPYRIQLASGWVYGHRDDHTLIRRVGMQPLARVRGISKRLEIRKQADGSKESIDHVTEKRKRSLHAVSSDSEDSEKVAD